VNHQNHTVQPGKTDAAPRSNGNGPSSSSSSLPEDGVAHKSRNKKKEEPEPAPVTGDILQANMNFSSAATQRSLA
jgi:hypothetical protein